MAVSVSVSPFPSLSLSLLHSIIISIDFSLPYTCTYIYPYFFISPSSSLSLSIIFFSLSLWKCRRNFLKQTAFENIVCKMSAILRILSLMLTGAPSTVILPLVVTKRCACVNDSLELLTLEQVWPQPASMCCGYGFDGCEHAWIH